MASSKPPPVAARSSGRRPCPPSRRRRPSPVSIPISRAARSVGTFPWHDSSTAAAFRTGPYATEPGWNPGGGAAWVIVPQPPQASPGSRTSVTLRRISMSMTCAHLGSAGAARPGTRGRTGTPPAAPPSPCRQGQGPVQALPWWPGCPPLFRSLLRSRSDRCYSPAAMPSFEVGVPEFELSSASRRSTSASRSSSRRITSAPASCAALSTALSASFAAMTSRSRALQHEAPQHHQAQAHRARAKAATPAPAMQTDTPDPAGRRAPGNRG